MKTITLLENYHYLIIYYYSIITNVIKTEGHSIEKKFATVAGKKLYSGSPSAVLFELSTYRLSFFVATEGKATFKNA